MPNFQILKSDRKDEVNWLVQGNEPEAEEEGIYCKCNSNPIRCPVSLAENSIEFSRSNFTTSQIMATHACYIPMANAGYDCEKIHMLALLGTDREGDFLAQARQDPGCVHTRDNVGNTPLMLACSARHPSWEVITSLLSNLSAVDVNTENHDGLTALHFAVLNNQPHIVEYLLERGADVDAGMVQWKDTFCGLTPVLMSVLSHCQGKNLCLQTLLKYKPNVDVETVESHNSQIGQLRFSIECDCGGCTSYDVIEPQNVLPPSQISNTNSWFATGSALYHASTHDDGNSLSMLMDYCEANGKCMIELLTQPTPYSSLGLFSVATDLLNTQVMKIMMKRCPAMINESTREDHLHAHPLHYLLWHERCFENGYYCLECLKAMPTEEDEATEIFNILLSIPEVDVNVMTTQGTTPLMLAAENGHDYVMERLLELGADPTAVDVDGNTPLLLALDLKTDVSLKVLRTLFRTGLSHGIYNEHFTDSAVLKKVCEKRDVEILNMFRQVGAFSQSNRISMLQAVETTFVEEAEQKKKERFLQALKVSNPWPLTKQYLLFVSAKLGVGSPQRRTNALKRVIFELNQTSNQKHEDDEELEGILNIFQNILHGWLI